MPTIVSLKPAQLENRLDAVYYGPGFLANHDRLVRSGIRTARLRSLVKHGRRAVYFSTDTIEADEAPESWIPFLTSDDLSEDGCFINLNAQRRVSPEFAAEYPNGRLRGNELLVKVKGPNQTTAYNSQEPNREILVSGTIWGALVDLDSVDPHFLVAALTSSYGATARTRLRTNTNVEFLAPEDLLGVLLPWPTQRPPQRYVGEKVRQAERLRAFAKTLLSEAGAYFSLPGMDMVRIGEFRSYRAGSSVVDSIRLDPKFYDPGHFKLRELLQPHYPFAISELASPVNLRWAREEPDFFYLEIGELDLGSGLIKPARLATPDAPSRATTLVQPGDVLVSTVRPNRKNVGLVLEVDEPLPIVASSGFSVLRFRSPEEAAFYLFWLRSDAATMQLMRWDAGSSYPAIDESVPLKVLVPRYADEVVREKGACWYQSFRAQVLAEKLTATAKLLVEALIEGKVTEAELVTAQEALERGDDTADRAVLRRLTRQGLDVPGQPRLFPDVDALYALLAQTKEAAQ